MGRIDSSQVDVEANSISLKVETDHPAVRQEVGGFTHAENRQAAQAPQDCGLAAGFVAAEEEDVATLDGLRRADQQDVKDPATDDLALDGALQLLAVRFVVEDAEVEGWAFGGEGAGRPVYKLREVELISAAGLLPARPMRNLPLKKTRLFWRRRFAASVRAPPRKPGRCIPDEGLLTGFVPSR